LGALALCVTTQTQGAAVYGAGNTSCTRWIENREFGEGWAELQEWALGYLTGINDNINVSAQETDGDAVVALLDDYCRRNPQQSLLDATRTLTQPPGIRIAGLGNTEGELGNQSQMNEICRTSYPYRTEGAFPVRWATTADFREYSTSKGWNHQMTRIEEPLSLRAAHTTFTQDGRAYDQATGAISAPGSRPYPGAVLFEDNAARFGGRRFTAKPLCVWGPPNNDLRD
jgi:hypothetical protein